MISRQNAHRIEAVALRPDSLIKAAQALAIGGMAQFLVASDIIPATVSFLTTLLAAGG